MQGEKTEDANFEEIYLKHHDMVFRYICRVVRNDDAAADDLTQEVFLVAYNKRNKLKEHPNVPGFLMKTAKNKLKKYFQEQKGIFDNDEESLDVLSKEESGSSGMDEYRKVDLYYTLENILSGKELNLLLHYYAYGYSTAEMAEKLGVSESCIKMRISRLKQKLRSFDELIFALIIVIYIGN